MVDDAKDMMVIINALENENALDLSKRMAIDIFKTKKESTNDLNKFIGKLLSFPTIILRLIAKTFKWLDYHGLLPESYT